MDNKYPEQIKTLTELLNADIHDFKFSGEKISNDGESYCVNVKKDDQDLPMVRYPLADIGHDIGLSAKAIINTVKTDWLEKNPNAAPLPVHPDKDGK